MIFRRGKHVRAPVSSACAAIRRTAAAKSIAKCNIQRAVEIEHAAQVGTVHIEAFIGFVNGLRASYPGDKFNVFDLLQDNVLLSSGSRGRTDNQDCQRTTRHYLEADQK